MSGVYSEAHKVLLTYIRSVRCISADELLEKFVILGEHFDIQMEEPMAMMRDYIAEINVRIAKAYFKIASVRDQETQEQQYVFINTKSDQFIQACSPYNVPELDAIKHLVDSIINANGYAFGLPYGNAKQEVATVLKQKLGEADTFIRRLVDDGWINLTDQHRLVLSPMSIAELAEYLKDRFGVFSLSDTLGKLLNCVVCNEVVTFGKKCPNTECPVSFHSKCFDVFRRDNRVCPNRTCSEPLDGIINVGTRSRSL